MSAREIIEHSYDDWVDSTAGAIFDKVMNCGSRTVNIALSGGKSPGPIYTKLSNMLVESRKLVDVNIFLVDERNVPTNSELSNSNLLLSIFPKRLVFPFDPVTTEAKDYWKIIKKRLFQSKFDIVVLGCGEDGHIASIFPDSQLNKKDSEYKDFVTCYTSVGVRHTLTLKVIAEARYKIIAINNNPLKHRYFRELKEDITYPINKIKCIDNTLTIINM